MNSTVAIIGGSGFETALQERLGRPALSQQVATEYGDADVMFFLCPDGPLAFLARHGTGHSIPPHRINHRANIAALRSVGVVDIISTAAVGSLSLKLEPGDFVIVDDFIDLRGVHPTTFYESAPIVHTDFSEPIDKTLRRRLLHAAEAVCESSGAPRSIIHASGVYLCVSGPRYETPAEVRCFAAMGADVVGMTVAPEAILAREVRIAYASISVVTNFATGLTAETLSHEDVEQAMSLRKPLLIDLLLSAAQTVLRVHSSSGAT